LLEKLFPTFKVVVGQQVIKRKEATNIGHILKIHGSTDRSEEIIVCSEDYRMFQEKQTYLIAKLLTYFMEHTVIFLGYSVGDSNIKSILSDISEMVSSDSDEIINNIWLVEWKDEKIDDEYKPPSDRTIDLGGGKSIRINYLLVNSFESLYESLYQDTAIEIDILNNLQNNIYNIIKSKTINNLEVDMVKVSNITDEEALAELIGLYSNKDKNSDSSDGVKLMGFGKIADPEKLMAMYPMRISKLAEKLGFSTWHSVDKILKQIQVETGFNLKESNNIYHIDFGINQAEHRYSVDAMELLKKVIDKKEYFVVIDDEGTELKPENIN